MSHSANHLPSVQALSAPDDRLLANELGIVATRHQLAVVRTLVDELERCAAHGHASTMLREQLVEELSRLGCRSIETAARLAQPTEADRISGVRLADALAG